MTAILLYIGLTAHGTAWAVTYDTFIDLEGQSRCRELAQVRNAEHADPVRPIDWNVAYTRPAFYPPLVAGGWHCIDVAS